LQLIVKRARKAGADQKIKLLIPEKFPDALPANSLSDASMKDLDFAIIDVAADYPSAISISARFIRESPQKF